jgi:hypothetical protein
VRGTTRAEQAVLALPAHALCTATPLINNTTNCNVERDLTSTASAAAAGARHFVVVSAQSAPMMLPPTTPCPSIGMQWRLVLPSQVNHVRRYFTRVKPVCTTWSMTAGIGLANKCSVVMQARLGLPCGVDEKRWPNHALILA